MSLTVEKIDLLVEEHSLLKHPFYQMWSKGELSQPDLVGYSMEYFQLVRAVPELVRNLMSQTSDSEILPIIKANMSEEIMHIKLWERFANSLGITKQQLNEHEGFPETMAAISKLRKTTTSSLEESAAAMYAYEVQIPGISKNKLEGLKRFYGLESEDSRIYFETHEEADIRHASLWRTILSRIDHSEEAIEAATKSLEAQNELLDSVMKAYVSPTHGQVIPKRKPADSRISS